MEVEDDDNPGYNQYGDDFDGGGMIDPVDHDRIAEHRRAYQERRDDEAAAKSALYDEQGKAADEVLSTFKVVLSDPRFRPDKRNALLQWLIENTNDSGFLPKTATNRQIQIGTDGKPYWLVRKWD